MGHVDQLWEEGKDLASLKQCAISWLPLCLSTVPSFCVYFSFAYISLLKDNNCKIPTGSEVSGQTLRTKGWKFPWSGVLGQAEVYRLYSELNIRNKPGVGVLLWKLTQEDCKSKTCLNYIFDLKANLDNVVKLCLKLGKQTNKNTNQTKQKTSSTSWSPRM